uniref:Uncharacterized protein n=1 Tax=viral metagenome TaxID=1070528 RepID=A0A6M3LUA4_9ZZZZ
MTKKAAVLIEIDGRYRQEGAGGEESSRDGGKSAVLDQDALLGVQDKKLVVEKAAYDFWGLLQPWGVGLRHLSPRP